MAQNSFQIFMGCDKIVPYEILNAYTLIKNWHFEQIMSWQVTSTFTVLVYLAIIFCWIFGLLAHFVGRKEDPKCGKDF